MYNYRVPNKRSGSKQIVALWLDEDYVTALDEARKRFNMDRSTFLRAAMSEKLDALEIKHDKAKIYPPDRTGIPHRRASGKTRAT